MRRRSSSRSSSGSDFDDIVPGVNAASFAKPGEPVRLLNSDTNALTHLAVTEETISYGYIITIHDIRRS